jgi:hypothetical protein
MFTGQGKMYHQKYHQFDTFYNHKFGFHITGPRQDAFNEVFRLKPKVVKTLDFSVDVMKRIRQEIPDVFLIGRLFVHPQDFGQLSGGTAQAARRKGVEMAEKILREEVNRDIHHLNGEPIFHAWESLNEVFPEWTDDNTQKLYDEYQVAFGEKILAAGFEPIAFNFGQGNGRGEQWLRLYPGTLETYKYLGFHEYDWPTMDRLHRIGLNGPSEIHNLVLGVGENRGNDGMWRALRYRRIMNEGIRQKFGDKHVCIITECGMTQGVWGGPSKDIGPWAKELTVPSDIPGGVVPTPIPVEDYWQSLLWYNSEIMKDDYVMGACLFVTGAAGLPEWETFEHLGPIMDRIHAFQKEIMLDPSARTPILPVRPSTQAQPATVTEVPPKPPAESAEKTLFSFRPHRVTPPFVISSALSTSSQQTDPRNVQVRISFRDGRHTYAVGERIFVTMEVINVASEPVSFGILGLLTSTGHFQTSWDNGLIKSGQTFRHEDGLAFDAPGTYKVQLSICFARKNACLSSDEGWERFEPGLQVIIQ